MKRSTNFLIPVAVLVLFGACLTSVLAFLVVLVASLGFEEWRLFVYFQKLDLPALSIALPIVGMILFAAILFGISGGPKEATASIVVENSSGQAAVGEARTPDPRLKAA